MGVFRLAGGTTQATAGRAAAGAPGAVSVEAVVGSTGGEAGRDEPGGALGGLGAPCRHAVKTSPVAAIATPKRLENCIADPSVRRIRRPWRPEVPGTAAYQGQPE
jgi:hypothetical protein